MVSYNEKLVKFPRERDQWLMQMFVAVGFSKEDLVRLNRVRIHQQALFLSYVIGASGKTLDPKYMTQRKEEERWSTLVFPKEKPPQRYFALWKLALHQVVPTGGITNRLGRLTQNGYNIWDWRLHYKDDKMYSTPNRWTRARMNQIPEERGMVCSVREAGLAVMAIVASAEPPRERVLPTEIQGVIKAGGCM